MEQGQDHDCSVFSATDFETGEQVCIKCGMVTQEADNRDIYVSDLEGRMMNATSSYAGNGLLNSETENMDYVSKKNPGLAYKINRGGKDFQGRRVKTSLNDAYRSGCIAGGKEMIVKQDPLTGEVSLKFNGYDKPMLRMVKERAMSELSRYNLDTVEMTIVAKECKRIVSQLFFGPMLEYAWMAAAINAGVLKKRDALAIEKAMYDLMEPIRVLLLSHGDKTLAAELTKPAQPIEAKS
ncbi:hypothetical protein Ngar_c17110 [Candidatus Nitrososphaera gargensis Ga9.2]|uniref:Uncharacterized protein n=2 Tax=Candidatus Nitrososphaera gargensis TaxID=497727 RepID=K0IN27_NITGG|nr:hypothetical protein Ngar_c17110 [Candidatus Nitrososphaera gargensis Ga9.2]